jgi:hypothetical protein
MQWSQVPNKNNADNLNNVRRVDISRTKIIVIIIIIIITKIIVIIEVQHFCQLHTKYYPTFCCQG